MTSPMTTASKARTGSVGGEQVARSARRGRAARARTRRRTAHGSTPTGSQPRSARLGEQEADPAAEVEQRAPRRRRARSIRSSAARARSRAGRPPPRRSRRSRRRRRPLEPRLGRERLGLPVPAGAAAHDVGQRGAEAVGGRDQALRARVAGHRRCGTRSGAPQAAQERRSSDAAVSRRALWRPAVSRPAQAALSVVAPMLNEEGTARDVLRARDARRSRGCRASSSSSTTARRDGTPEILAEIAVDRSARARRLRSPATSATRRRSPPGSTTRAATRSSMIDADLQDPPELIPTMLEHWRARLRRRLRHARRPQGGGDALQARDRALVLPDLRRGSGLDLAPERGRLPPARPARPRRPARDARAQPLPARHDRLGRLHADRRPLRPRRALRGRDEVHARARWSASRSTRSRRSRASRCSSRRCSASSSRSSPSWRCRS